MYSTKNASWMKQTRSSPLYTDLLWSKPEQRQHAGKLLLIGGAIGHFAHVARAYDNAMQAGIGSLRVILPISLQKIIGHTIPAAIFGHANPSGSFGLESLATWLEHAAWADTVLLPGELGNNSETNVCLERFMYACNRPVIVSGDILNDTARIRALAARPQTTIVGSLAQLQGIPHDTPVTHDMGIPDLVAYLQALTNRYPAVIVTYHMERFAVAYQQQVSVTTSDTTMQAWAATIAARSAVWQAQNPAQTFAATTTAITY